MGTSRDVCWFKRGELIADLVEVDREFVSYVLVGVSIKLGGFVRAEHRFNVSEEVTLSVVPEKELLLMVVESVHSSLNQIPDDLAYVPSTLAPPHIPVDGFSSPFFF